MVPASARTEADAVDVQGQPAVDKGEEQQDQGSKKEGSLMILLFNRIDFRRLAPPASHRAGRGATGANRAVVIACPLHDR